MRKNDICSLCHISCRFKLTQRLWSLPRCQPQRFSHHWTWAWWQTSSGCWVVSEDVFFVSYGAHNIEVKFLAAFIIFKSTQLQIEVWTMIRKLKSKNGNGSYPIGLQGSAQTPAHAQAQTRKASKLKLCASSRVIVSEPREGGGCRVALLAAHRCQVRTRRGVWASPVWQ